jgi:hypothetical protein
MSRTRKRDRAGTDDRDISNIDPQRCSFLDVRHACHRWLMQRDPIYRQQRRAWEDSNSRRGTFAPI